MAFTSPEKTNKPPTKTLAMFTTCFIVPLFFYCRLIIVQAVLVSRPFIDQYQRKCCIIDDIIKIGIYTFADEGLAFIKQDLFNAQDLRHDQVYKTFLAHFPPGFAVVMVLIFHQLLCNSSFFIV